MDKESITPTNVDREDEEASFYTPLSLDFVSAVAGDRPLSDREKVLVNEMIKERGGKFYSDLLYAVTHRFFSAVAAEDLWNRILSHKYEMSKLMNRNIRIAVASLDYLSNLTTELASATVSDETFIAELTHLSEHDGLTGLFNHSCCYRKTGSEMKRFVRYGTPVSFMMIDVDNFKEINDTLGHQAGDNLLMAMGKVIREEVRESDICCRYGGDEFAVIMPLTATTDACVLAERLRARIEQSLFDGGKITVSIGVASSDRQVLAPQDLVQKADLALYRIKKAGKNGVAAGD